MLPSLSPLRALALSALLALAACESAEERAEGHYQSALTLIEEGETEKAKIELRNVFRLNGTHVEARERYALLLVEDGELEEAIGQFLRLVEQAPENLTGRLQLGRLMLLTGNWEEAGRHIEAAFELAPADAEVGTLKATLDYRTGDPAAGLARAADLVAADSSNVDARLLIIADRINAEDYAGALDLTDQALLVAPDNLALQAIRLSALERLGETAEVGAQLERMIALQPDNRALKNNLYRWNLREGNTDGAEAALRAMVADDPEAEANAAALLGFLVNFRGADAARAEFESAREAEDPKRALYTRLLAGLEDQFGNRDRAIALMEEEIARLEEGEALNAARNIMAQLQRLEGDPERAAELVGLVLENDSRNVPALIERGRQRLAADDYTGAISDLRAAINEAPDNSTALTLLARAHERNGSRDLARERLALAVQVSRRGPEESMRYAEFLMREGNMDVAMSVIEEALIDRPGDARLLSGLAQMRLAREDWVGAEEIALRLEALGTDRGERGALAIRSRILTGQERFDESVDLLLGQLAQDEDDLRALREVTLTYLRAGEPERARALLEQELEADPGDVFARFLLAGVNAATGEVEAAIGMYRDIIADEPGAAFAYEALAVLLRGTGQGEEAVAVIAAGAEANPDNPRLLVSRAGTLERQGAFEEAIAIYDRLYDRDPGNTLVANNLASLIAEHRDDAESLSRAARVAQRLRASANPAFLDTYGWVLYRNGSPEQALDPLRRAVALLPGVALVQYHAGMVYAALGQSDQARVHLEEALALAGPANLLPDAALAEAQATLDGLELAQDTTTPAPVE